MRYFTKVWKDKFGFDRRYFVDIGGVRRHDVVQLLLTSGDCCDKMAVRLMGYQDWHDVPFENSLTYERAFKWFEEHGCELIYNRR